MGPTGAGKSTLASYFADLSLKAFENEETFQWVINHKEEGKEPRIADPNNISFSETVIPNQVIRQRDGHDSVNIIDCPGFADTKGYK